MPAIEKTKPNYELFAVGFVNSWKYKYKKRRKVPLSALLSFSKNNPSGFRNPTGYFLKKPYSTVTRIPSEWEVNSGAYMHWMVVMPLEKSPFWVANIVYSNT